MYSYEDYEVYENSKFAVKFGVCGYPKEEWLKNTYPQVEQY